MREFITAKEREDAEDAEVLTFKHDDQEVTFIEPSSGQIAVMLSMSTSGKNGTRNAQIILQFFFSVMDDETAEYFQDRLMDPRDPFDLDGEGGVMELFEFIMEEWSGKDSKQPSDYQPSRKATGGQSKGTTRAKGSTSSNSRSRASSTSSKSGR